MKSLIVIFTTGHANTLGNACRLDMIRFLEQNFDVHIVTNQVAFITTYFPHCEVTAINAGGRTEIPLIAETAAWYHLSRQINIISHDAVFMFHDTAPAAKRIRTPVFQYVHQYGERVQPPVNRFRAWKKLAAEKYRERLTVKGLKKSEINFVVSQQILDMLKKKGLKNLELLPHAMDLEKYQKPLLTDFHNNLRDLRDAGFFIVAYTGWVSENRGLELMLQSISKAISSDGKIVLVIAGADKQRTAKIDDYARQQALTGNILNTGIIDETLIPGILHYSDVCLSFLDDVPAHHLSPPQKIAAYFAAGKPVICNKIETHEEMVTHEKNGFIVNYEAGEVSEAILRLKNHPDILDKMAENALETASKYAQDTLYGRMVHQMKEQAGGR